MLWTDQVLRVYEDAVFYFKGFLINRDKIKNIELRNVIREIPI